MSVECLEDRVTPSTFTVTTRADVVDPADGKLSLREAITRANDRAGTDTIVLPAGITRMGIVGAAEDANATGDFDITDTVVIRGAGAGVSIIDARQVDRVFDVIGTAPGSIRLVLQDLTVFNGKAGLHGGGIQIANADLVVRDSAVTGNRAGSTGGGISNQIAPGTGNVTLVRATLSRNGAGQIGGGIRLLGADSVFTANNSTVHRNVARASAGGIFATTVMLTNCVVSGNSAGDTNGGGISADTVTLTSSTVSGNSAGELGGGIIAGTVTLSNSTVSGNYAGQLGGGIYAGAATLTNSTVSGNTAPVGGGIYANSATLTNSTVSGNIGSSGGGIFTTTATLTNTTVSGNTAKFGGGIYATTATLGNCTIADNTAITSGGGVYHTPGGTLSLMNTIVARNLAGTGSQSDLSGDFTSAGHNLIGDGTGSTGFTDGVNDDMVGTSAAPIDPRIGALANNGGRTKTHALLAGSPAIDRGENMPLPPTDQRGGGFGRRKDGDGNGSKITDIGAFER